MYYSLTQMGDSRRRIPSFASGNSTRSHALILLPTSPPQWLKMTTGVPGAANGVPGAPRGAVAKGGHNTTITKDRNTNMSGNQLLNKNINKGTTQKSITLILDCITRQFV